MSKYTFELGFDLSVSPTPSGAMVRYPLQWSLVDEANSVLVSPVNLKLLKTDDSLAFRIYDITQMRPPEPRWTPVTLQILFSSATSLFNSVPFSPLTESQITTVAFTADAPASVAFGVDNGWKASDTAKEVQMVNSGRFELRMLLTVTRIGEMARYYYVDPEMVVGDSGTEG